MKRIYRERATHGGEYQDDIIHLLTMRCSLVWRVGKLSLRSIFLLSSARRLFSRSFIRATLNGSFIVQGASELLDTDGDKYRRLQCCLRKATAAVNLQFNFPKIS